MHELGPLHAAVDFLARITGELMKLAVAQEYRAVVVEHTHGGATGLEERSVALVVVAWDVVALWMAGMRWRCRSLRVDRITDST